MSFTSTQRLGSVVMTLSIAGATAGSAAVQERDRSKIADKYKWNLADVYPSETAWRAAKDKLAKDLTQLDEFKGRLGTSAATLADALDTINRFSKELSRIAAYASMLADQDTRQSGPQGMRQEVTQLDSAFRTRAAFFEPEVLRLADGTIERFLAAEPRLAVYRFPLQDIRRRASHTLSDTEERLLASAGPIAQAPSNVYGLIANADLPFPTITLSDGRTVKLDQAAFADLRALPNRTDRENVMRSFFTTLGSFGRTFGATLDAEVPLQLTVQAMTKVMDEMEAILMKQGR